MIRPDVRRRARDAIRAAMLAETKHRSFPLRHQLALHLDLYSRQRRATAAQINFLTDEVSIAPLFYTREMLEFWANLDYEDLREQSLYLDFAHTRFPALFPPARRPSLSERAQGSLVNVAIDLWPDLKRRLKPQEIDTGAITRRHLDEINRLVSTCGDIVAHIVDLDALNTWLAELDENRAVGADQLQRFWNLLLLLEAGLDSRGGTSSA